MRKEISKLVRDNVPAIISKDTSVEKFSYHQCNNKVELIEALLNKVIEEATELKNSHIDTNISLDEFVDVLEVVDRLKQELPWTSDEIEEARAKKAKEKGAFDIAYVLDEITYKE